VLRDAPAQFIRQWSEVIEKRFYELVKLLPVDVGRMGAAGTMSPQKLLQLDDLPAHGRLLDAIRDVRTASLMPPCRAT